MKGSAALQGVLRHSIESESACEMKECQWEMKRLILSSHIHEIALQNHSDERVKEECWAQPQCFHLHHSQEGGRPGRQWHPALARWSVWDVLAGRKGWHRIQAAPRCWMCNAKAQDNNSGYLLQEDLSGGRTGPLPATQRYYSASQCFCLFRAEL